MRCSRSPLLAALLACLGLACDEHNDIPVQLSPPWSTERATVGDTTIVRTVGAWTPTANLQLHEEISIGTLDGPVEQTFGSITHVVPLGRSVLIYDGQIRQVRLYDSSGAFVRNIGRRGQGPGEYGGVAAIDVLADGRFALWANGNRRINIHNARGEYESSIPFPSIARLGNGLPLTVTSGRSIFVKLGIDDPLYPDSIDAFGERPGTWTAVRHDSLGNVMDSTLIPWSARAQTMFRSRRKGEDSYESMLIPFAPYFRAIFSPLGYWVSSESDRYSVTLHRSGALLRIESDIAIVPATEDERRAALTAMAEAINKVPAVDVPALDLIPTTKPSIKEIRADREGRIWVQISRASEGGVEPTTYDIFGPDGDFLGRLELPDRATFASATGNTVWLVHRDSLDVPRAVRYRVSVFSNAPSSKYWLAVSP